jgi:predicted DCC family thiol-disulfide oxidoreductase YuxK
VTSSPERSIPASVLLYDGHCRLCVGGARRLQALARRGAVELRDFQPPGALDAFPGLTRDECMRAMVMVTPDGRRFHGAQAVAEALGTRRLIGPTARLYYLPGLRALCDAAYAWIARNRYRLFGRAPACADDACAVHFGARRRKS